jgi:hypothetical protein
MKRVNNATTVTVISGYGTTATVTLDHADVSLDEMFDAFKGCLVGVSWSEENVIDYIKEWAEQIKDTEEFVRKHLPMSGDEEEIDLMVDTLKKESVYDDAVCVLYNEEHKDFWASRGFNLFSNVKMGITSANIWHVIYGGLQHYKELTKEEFEERFYKPWKKLQQSLDISNA